MPFDVAYREKIQTEFASFLSNLPTNENATLDKSRCDDVIFSAARLSKTIAMATRSDQSQPAYINGEADSTAASVHYALNEVNPLSFFRNTGNNSIYKITRASQDRYESAQKTPGYVAGLVLTVIDNVQRRLASLPEAFAPLQTALLIQKNAFDYHAACIHSDPQLNGQPLKVYNSANNEAIRVKRQEAILLAKSPFDIPDEEDYAHNDPRHPDYDNYRARRFAPPVHVPVTQPAVTAQPVVATPQPKHAAETLLDSALAGKFSSEKLFELANAGHFKDPKEQEQLAHAGLLSFIRGTAMAPVVISTSHPTEEVNEIDVCCERVSGFFASMYRAAQSSLGLLPNAQQEDELAAGSSANAAIKKKMS